MRSCKMDCRVHGTLSPTDFVVEAYRPATHVTESPALGWLAQAIEQVRLEGRLLGRADVTPRQIGPQAMPNVVMVDVEAVPRRYRLRLIGTALVRAAGLDNTGRYFDELAEEQREANGFFVKVMDRLVSCRRPLIYTANMFFRDMEWVRYRCLAAPLAGEDGQVDRIVGAAELLPWKP